MVVCFALLTLRLTGDGMAARAVSGRSGTFVALLDRAPGASCDAYSDG
jgi:hypothetical protein